MSHETAQRISPARARQLLRGKPLPARRTCTVIAASGAQMWHGLPTRRVVSICNVYDEAREVFKDTYELDTDDREMVTPRRRRQ